MRKICFLLALLFPISLFSQNDIPEKFADVQSLTTPYTDKTDMKIDNKIKITEADWLSYHLGKLETYDIDFEYFAYGKINLAGFDVLLTERKSFEEKNHWAVFFKNGKYLSHLNISYDNSEGFLYIESDIQNDKILIKETNNFDDRTYSETTYTLKETGFEKCK